MTKRYSKSTRILVPTQTELQRALAIIVRTRKKPPGISDTSTRFGRVLKEMTDNEKAKLADGLSTVMELFLKKNRLAANQLEPRQKKKNKRILLPTENEFQKALAIIIRMQRRLVIRASRKRLAKALEVMHHTVKAKLASSLVTVMESLLENNRLSEIGLSLSADRLKAIQQPQPV